MKKVLPAICVLLLATVAAAQKPMPPGAVEHSKILGPQSAITVHVNGLNCTTTAGTGGFPVQSWMWGASNPATTNTGSGAGSSKASISELVVQKVFDACSPALFGAVTTGKTFSGMTLVQQDTSGNVVVTLTLSNVLVTGWNISGTTSNETPVESVSFAFSKICVAEPTSSSQFCYNAGTAAAQ